MKSYHIRQTAFSNYRMGVSLPYPDVKHNRFKAKQRMATRLARGDHNGLC